MFPHADTVLVVVLTVSLAFIHQSIWPPVLILPTYFYIKHLITRSPVRRPKIKAPFKHDVQTQIENVHGVAKEFCENFFTKALSELEPKIKNNISTEIGRILPTECIDIESRLRSDFVVANYNFTSVQAKQRHLATELEKRIVNMVDKKEFQEMVQTFEKKIESATGIDIKAINATFENLQRNIVAIQSQAIDLESFKKVVDEINSAIQALELEIDNDQLMENLFKNQSFREMLKSIMTSIVGSLFDRVAELESNALAYRNKIASLETAQVENEQRMNWLEALNKKSTTARTTMEKEIDNLLETVQGLENTVYDLSKERQPMAAVQQKLQTDFQSLRTEMEAKFAAEMEAMKELLRRSAVVEPPVGINTGIPDSAKQVLPPPQTFSVVQTSVSIAPSPVSESMESADTGPVLETELAASVATPNVAINTPEEDAEPPKEHLPEKTTVKEVSKNVAAKATADDTISPNVDVAGSSKPVSTTVASATVPQVEAKPAPIVPSLERPKDWATFKAPKFEFTERRGPATVQTGFQGSIFSLPEGSLIPKPSIPSTDVEMGSVPSFDAGTPVPAPVAAAPVAVAPVATAPAADHDEAMADVPTSPGGEPVVHDDVSMADDVGDISMRDEDSEHGFHPEDDEVLAEMSRDISVPPSAPTGRKIAVPKGRLRRTGAVTSAPQAVAGPSAQPAQSGPEQAEWNEEAFRLATQREPRSDDEMSSLHSSMFGGGSEDGAEDGGDGEDYAEVDGDAWLEPV